MSTFCCDVRRSSYFFFFSMLKVCMWKAYILLSTLCMFFKMWMQITSLHVPQSTQAMLLAFLGMQPSARKGQEGSSRSATISVTKHILDTHLPKLLWAENYSREPESGKLILCTLSSLTVLPFNAILAEILKWQKNVISFISLSPEVSTQLLTICPLWLLFRTANFMQDWELQDSNLAILC